MAVLFGAAWMVLDQPEGLFGDEAPRRGEPLKVVGVRSFDWQRIMDAAGHGDVAYQTLANEGALIDWVGQGSDVVLGSRRVVTGLRERGRVADGMEAVEVASSPWVLVYREGLPAERTWASWWKSTSNERLGIPDDPALLLTLSRKARGTGERENGFDVGVFGLEDRSEPRSELDLNMASLHRLALRIRRVDTPEALVSRMRAGELDAALLPVHWAASLDEGWSVWRPDDGFPVRQYFGVVLSGSTRSSDASAWLGSQVKRFDALQMPALEKNLRGPFFPVDVLPEEERRAIRRIVRGMEQTGKHIDRSMDNDLLINP